MAIVDLAKSQLASVINYNQQQANEIVRRACYQAETDGVLVYFAAFDGTNNDMTNAGNPQNTNIAQLWLQYEPKLSTYRQGGYFPGPGTKGTVTASSWWPPNVTEQVEDTAKAAVEQLNKAVKSALPDGGEVMVFITAFSRGCASAALFCQQIAQGVGDNPAKIRLHIGGGVLFDPVMTGVKAKLDYPACTAHIVQIEALNEYRYLFIGADYAFQDHVVQRFGMYGNHCDIGGSYDNGLAAIPLKTATQYLQGLGLALGDVNPNRVFKSEEVRVHTEEYDDHGNKIWDVYDSDGFSFDPDIRLLKRAN